MLAYLLTAAGFVLLLGGGELLVRGAVAIARRLGLSELLVGLTVVAFGTSAPELVVSVGAALSGNADIATGNVVGSNICNIALILGIGAFVKPLVVDRADIRPDAWAMLGAVAVLYGLGLTGAITRWQGSLLFAGLVVYLVWSYRREVADNTVGDDWRTEEAREVEPVPGNARAIAFVAAGVTSLVIGADWLVDGATAIAAALGVPDAVVALTVVALGTSLPELATSVVAGMRGHPDVAVGNVLGSTLFNILSILGITAMVAPLEISERITRVDMPVMVAFSAIAVVVLMTRGRIGRPLGGALVAGYVAYVAMLYAA